MDQNSLFNQFYYLEERLNNCINILGLKKIITQFYLDAVNCGSSLLTEYRDKSLPQILVKCADISYDNIIGFIIVIGNCDITTYFAVQDENFSIRCEMIIDTFSLGSDFKFVVDRTLQKVNICPICNKEVGYKHMKLYSYANRCCYECYPKMKHLYEPIVFK